MRQLHVCVAFFAIQGIVAAETITTPSEDDVWACPGTHGLHATGCTGPTYRAVVLYQSGTQWIELHSQQPLSPDDDDEINVSLFINGVPPCGQTDGFVQLHKLVYMPMPHWESVAAVKIKIQGAPCP